MQLLDEEAEIKRLEAILEQGYQGDELGESEQEEMMEMYPSMNTN